MSKFKVGDRVQITHALSHVDTPHVGKVATIRGEHNANSMKDWFYLQGIGFAMVEDQLQLVETHGSETTFIQNLKQAFASVFKGEPQKSFKKAGVTDASDVLTEDGKSVFLSWLLKKHGEEFQEGSGRPDTGRLGEAGRLALPRVAESARP